MHVLRILNVHLIDGLSFGNCGRCMACINPVHMHSGSVFTPVNGLSPSKQDNSEHCIDNIIHVFINIHTNHTYIHTYIHAYMHTYIYT